MNRNEINFNFNFVSTYENKQIEKQLQDVIPFKRSPDDIVYTDDDVDDDMYNSTQNTDYSPHSR